MPNAVDLVSLLARDECVRRLQANCGSDKPVVGHVGDASFRLRKRIGYVNSFQTYLSGQLLDEDGRTRVRCRLGMHPIIFAFTSLLVAAPVLGIALGRAPADGTGSIEPALTFMAAIAAIVGIGRHLAREERQFLLDFLSDTIAAQQA